MKLYSPIWGLIDTDDASVMKELRALKARLEDDELPGSVSDVGLSDHFKQNCGGFEVQQRRAIDS